MSEQQISEHVQFSIISVPDKNPVFDLSRVPSVDSGKEILTGWLLQVSKDFAFYEKLDAKRRELMNMNIAKTPDSGSSFLLEFMFFVLGFATIIFLPVWGISSIVDYFKPNVICSYITWKNCLIADVILSIYVAYSDKRSSAKFKKEWKQKVADIDTLFQNENFSNLYMKTIDLLGVDYRDSVATDKFAMYFINGRCDTLKEAKNLYEKECANKRLEHRLNDIDDRASAAMRLAESAASVASAAYSTANAAYNKANRY